MSATRPADPHAPDATTGPAVDRRVVVLDGELIASRRVGAYHHLTFAAPGIADSARPGHDAE